VPTAKRHAGRQDQPGDDQEAATDPEEPGEQPDREADRDQPREEDRSGAALKPDVGIVGAAALSQH
jgi:hypothetical protein